MASDTTKGHSTEPSTGVGAVFVRMVGYASSLSGWISASMIVAAVAITCQMIYVRSVLNDSTVWQTEAVVYLMVAATLLGLPYVQLFRGHIYIRFVVIDYCCHGFLRVRLLACRIRAQLEIRHGLGCSALDTLHGITCWFWVAVFAASSRPCCGNYRDS